MTPSDNAGMLHCPLPTTGRGGAIARQQNRVPLRRLLGCRSHLLPDLECYTVPNLYTPKPRRCHRSASTPCDRHRPVHSNNTDMSICEARPTDKKYECSHRRIDVRVVKQERRIHDNTKKNKQQIQTGQSHTSKQVHKYQDCKTDAWKQ